MVFFKVAPVFLLILVVGAEKKIELQDIEEDNLKSEKQKEYETSDLQPKNLGSGSGIAVAPLDFMKNDFFRFFDNPSLPHKPHKPYQPHQPYQPSRFVQQYAVSEAPERASVQVAPKVQYSQPAPQQAMVGYLSNVPMQIYLVPQYYNEADQGENGQAKVQYTPGSHYTSTAHHVHGSSQAPNYQTAPEAVQTQTNYIEVPTYVAPTAKSYVPQYSSAPVTYVSYAHQPTVAVAPTVAPVVTYQVPVVQYPTAVIAPHPTPKSYYQNTHYQDTNAVEEPHEVDESPKEYSHTDVTYSKAPNNFPRFYSARPPPRDEYRHNHIQELPHPHSLLLKGSPPHLAHIPKALPVFRPLNKPVYGPPPSHPGVLAGRPNEHYSPFKRRPTSLLDSYIPSSVQIEYMKRGFTNDPLQAYEDLSSGRHLSHAPTPRHLERGFLPNQIYHTGGGGVTFGHYKRASKVDKASRN